MAPTLARTVVAGLALSLAGPVCLADITWVERVTAIGQDPPGGRGFTEITVSLSGERRRVEAIRRQGKGSGGRPGEVEAEVVRLDEGLVFRIDQAKRRYTEETFDEHRARTRRMARRAGARFTGVTTSIEPTGSTRTVEGLPCEQILVTVSGSLVDDEAAAPRPLTLSGDLCMSRSFPGGREIAGFRDKLVAGLGFDPAPGRPSAADEPALGEFFGEVSKLSGFPLSMTIKATTPAATEGRWEVGREPSGDEEEDGGDRSGATPLVMSGVGKKYRLRDEVAARPGRAAPRGREEWVLMRAVVSWSEDPVSPDRFRPPEDYQRRVPKSRGEGRKDPP